MSPVEMLEPQVEEEATSILDPEDLLTNEEIMISEDETRASICWSDWWNPT